MDLNDTLRAVDKETNEIHSVMDIDFMQKVVGICSVPQRMFQNGRLHTVHSVKKSFDDVILLGYTEMTDINGNEVLNGDKVKYYKDEHAVNMRGVGGYLITGAESGIKEALQLRNGEIEVIGNIWFDRTL